jgi:hypothetical protein
VEGGVTLVVYAYRRRFRATFRFDVVVCGCRMMKGRRTVGFEPPTRFPRLIFTLPLSVPLLLFLSFLPSFSTSHYSPHVLSSISFDVSWRESVCERR